MRKELDQSLNDRVSNSSTLSFAAAGAVLLVAMVYAVLIWGVFLPRAGGILVNNNTVNATVEFGVILTDAVKIYEIANGSSSFVDWPIRSVSVLPIVLFPETAANFYLNVSSDNPDNRTAVLQRPGYYTMLITFAFAARFAQLPGGQSCTLVVIRANAPGFLFGTPVEITTSIYVSQPSVQSDTLPAYGINQFDFYYNSTERYNMDMLLSCQFYNNSFEFETETISFMSIVRKEGFVPA